MKNKIFDVLFEAGKLTNYCLRSMFKKCYTIKYFFYSGWVAAQFKVTGKDFLIKSPTYIVGAKNVKIGDSFHAGPGLRIEVFSFFNNQKFNPSIIIGNNVRFGWDCHIGCINEVKIGNNVLLGSRVYISDHSHGDSSLNSLKVIPLKRELITKGNIIIEDDVWIGDGVAILPGVHIGKGAIIGANSVVTKNILEYSVAVGAPAKVIKHFSD